MRRRRRSHGKRRQVRRHRRRNPSFRVVPLIGAAVGAVIGQYVLGNLLIPKLPPSLQTGIGPSVVSGAALAVGTLGGYTLAGGHAT